VRVWTIGHSDRPVDAFVALLRENGVALVADVRSVPRSRHAPQYDTAVLPAELAEAGIGYAHLKSLGGWRHARKDSVNTGWRNASFRGYADYMQTPEFAAGLAELIALASEKPTAIMCAEAVPWRCHRSLIADALLVRGIEACEILGPGKARPHRLTPFAKVEGERITYPAEPAEE
jgi:uncharacterized protein (DUF488 family)